MNGVKHMLYTNDEKTFHVYIVASQRKGTLYAGMTANIARRAYEHANGIGEGFSATNRTDILVYIEPQPDFASAERREKRIKHWKRAWKIELIEKANPTWMDLCRKVGAARREGGREGGWAHNDGSSLSQG